MERHFYVLQTCHAASGKACDLNTPAALFADQMTAIRELESDEPRFNQSPPFQTPFFENRAQPIPTGRRKASQC